MATPFDATPKWFNAQYYLDQKLAKLQADDPKGNWTMASMKAAFAEAGFTNPFDHYLVNGDSEGLNPNSMFNGAEYLAAKVADLGSTWTAEMVAETIHTNGLTFAQHYEQFGANEGLNPSSKFDQNKYYEAKLDQLQATDPKGEWTHEKMVASFEANGITPLTHYLTFGKAEGLQDAKYDYSVGGKPIPHPGNTIALTTAVDVVTPDATDAAFKTSSRDDVISGVVSSSSAKNTFNANDVIDGGEGRDVLQLTLEGSFTSGLKDGSVKNVETVELLKASGKTFSAKNFEGVQQYVIDGGASGSIIVKDVENTTPTYSLAQEKGSFSVQVVDKAIAGKADSVTVALNSVGTSKADGDRVTISVKGTSTGVVEGLNLIADAKENFVKVAEAHETIAVGGAGKLDLTLNNAGKLITFDGSANEGGVVADLAGAKGTLKAVTGGAGNDTITVSTPLTATVFAGGDGDKDVLKFVDLADPSTINNTISGFETLEFADGAASTDVKTTLNLSNVTGLATIKMSNATGTTFTGDDVLTVKGAANQSALNFQLHNKLGTSDAGDTEFHYDGTGVLNASLYGDSTGGAGTALKVLDAKYVNELNIANTSEAGAFTITTIEARSATAMNIDTGDKGVILTGTNNVLGSVENIKVSGFGTAKVVFSDGAQSSKLQSVNAEDLQNKLDLDLSNATVGTGSGVTVTMGNGGTSTTLATAAEGIKGTALSDTFYLGSAAEKVNLIITNDTFAKADQIYGFDSSDIIGGTGAAGSAAATKIVADGETLASIAAGVKHVVITGKSSISGFALNNEGKVIDAIAAALVSCTATGVRTFVLDDGTNLGVYSAKIAATASVVASDVTELSFMGVINGFDSKLLSENNFGA